MRNPFKKKKLNKKVADNTASFANRRHVQEFNKGVAKKAEDARKKKES